jgi:anti-sigma regulatory factor (Ser/Thr protein kinase)
VSHDVLLLTLHGVPESVSEARHAVAKFLGDPSQEAADVVLLVSELVTNAILHTQSRHDALWVSVTRSDDDVTVAVVDKGSQSIPVVKSASLTDACGRGLRLVQEYADEWGSAPSKTGSLVWFRASLTHI